eukprot:5822708-Lingulodinium_polyedra.AAC.1
MEAMSEAGGSSSASVAAAACDLKRRRVSSRKAQECLNRMVADTKKEQDAAAISEIAKKLQEMPDMIPVVQSILVRKRCTDEKEKNFPRGVVCLPK